MSLKVCYVPHLLKDKEGLKWAENTMVKNLQINAKEIEIIPGYGIKDIFKEGIDLICFHNMSNTLIYRRPWIRGASKVERYLGKPIPALYDSQIKKISRLTLRPKIIGGVRGNQGLSIAKNFVKYFDAVHTSNNYIKIKALEYGAQKAYVLYPGVNLDLFKPNMDLRPKRFTIGWAGDSEKPMKNAELIKRLPYHKILATKQFFIPHDEMNNFYNACDVYTYFSSHEGCNRTILEAMACGLPVVSSNAGAIRKLIDDYWIIDCDPKHPRFMLLFKNRVEQLKNDEELRISVGKQNRESVRAWGWDAITKRFEDICKRVIES